MAIIRDISGGKVTDVDSLLELVNKRFEAVPWEHPDQHYAAVDFQLAMLASADKEHINRESKMGTADASGYVFNRLSVAYGLVSPELVPPAANSTRQARESRALKVANLLREFPDEFIVPIANEVWRMTNAYANEREGGNEPSPFQRRNSSSTGSATDGTSTPTPSRRGATSD